MSEETQKLLTFVLAAIGALLGIANAWRQWHQDKVKLGLTWTTEAWGGKLGKATIVHSVRVENQSNFVVTIDDVGLQFKKNGAPQVSFSQTIKEGEDTITKQLPIRLEPRDAIVLTSNGDNKDSIFREFEAQHLYLRTACGVIKELKSPT